MDEKEAMVVSKFCRLSAKSEKEKEECKRIFLELMNTNTDLLLKKMCELTGKSEDELVEILLKSCPGCPE